MSRTYAECVYCGGHVEEKLETRETRRNGDLVLIENVPMGVCNQCGERYLFRDVAEQIDLLLERKAAPARTIEVPVFTFNVKVA